MTRIVQKIEDAHGVRVRFGFVVPQSFSCNQIRIVHKDKIAPREKDTALGLVAQDYSSSSPGGGSRINPN